MKLKTKLIISSIVAFIVGIISSFHIFAFIITWLLTFWVITLGIKKSDLKRGVDKVVNAPENVANRMFENQRRNIEMRELGKSIAENLKGGNKMDEEKRGLTKEQKENYMENMFNPKKDKKRFFH